MTPLTFAVLLPVLLVAHHLGDFWIQTDQQAADKGLPGWTGRLACARHVATYTATTALAVGAAWWWLRLPVTPAGFVAGQVVSAVTHYWADRRTTLAVLAERVGKRALYRLGQPRRIELVERGTGNRAEVDVVDMATGMNVPLDNPVLGTGAAALDQAWHWAWLLVAAAITAGVR